MSKIKNVWNKIKSNPRPLIKYSLMTAGVLAGTALAAAFVYKPSPMDAEDQALIDALDADPEIETSTDTE